MAQAYHIVLLLSSDDGMNSPVEITPRFTLVREEMVIS
jgi:hypothetical protein